MEEATGNSRTEIDNANTSTPWKLRFVKSPVTETCSFMRDQSDSGFESFVSGLTEKEKQVGITTFQKTLKVNDDDKCVANNISDPHIMLEVKTVVPHSDADVNKQNSSVTSPSSRSVGLWKPDDLSNQSFIILDESNENFFIENEGEGAVNNLSGLSPLSVKSESVQCHHTSLLKPIANVSIILLDETSSQKSLEGTVRETTPISGNDIKVPYELKEQLPGTEEEKSEKGNSEKLYSTHTSLDSETVLSSGERKISGEQVRHHLSSEPQPIATGLESERLENGNFVSSDPQENADNNNPEWELLKKLETDEERYKAVRLRWRNLVIPNPNKNQTHRSRGYRGAEKKENVLKEANKITSRKRTHSADPKECNASRKRQRTFSCTEVFDHKIMDLRQNLNRERNVILQKHKQAVQDLVDKTNMQLSSYMPGSATDQRIRSLHVQNVVELRCKCDEQLAAAESESMNQLSSLQKAMEEVRVFNSFYQGLEEGREDALLLTQEQLVEVLEEDHLYDCFTKFYKG